MAGLISGGRRILLLMTRMMGIMFLVVSEDVGGFLVYHCGGEDDRWECVGMSSGRVWIGSWVCE